MGIFKRLAQSLSGSFRSSKPKAKQKSSRKPASKKQKPAVKSAASKSKKKTPAKKAKRKKVPSRSKPRGVATRKSPAPGILIGSVTHYFSHVHAAVVKIGKSGLALGDQVYFKGHTTDFKQVLRSLQIDRQPIEKAGRGDEIGVGVEDRVRIGDRVYKLER